MIAGRWMICLLAAAVVGVADAAEVPTPRVIDDRLTLDLVAAEPRLVTPTGVAVDDRGRVLVIESHTHFRPEGYDGPPADRIQRFEDRDGDGTLETVATFFEGTTATMNLALYHDGSVYVATRNEVFRLRDADDDGRAEERTPIVRLESEGNYPHNGLSGFAFDARGDVFFGFGENLGAAYKLIGSDGTTLSGGGEGGNIYMCAADGSSLRQIATGFWNPFHLCFDVFGRLFAVDNDPDSRPPCRLLHIVPQGDYGYRFRNGRKGLHPFTAWNGELPGTLPMVAGTGEAPSAVVAYESDNLPRDYLGSLLVTSWGDHRIERYRLQPRGASFVSTMEPVVTGGENFRPVGMAKAPDGSLYISDWVDKSYKLHGKGRLWRLRAKAPGELKRPSDPVEALHSMHQPLREAAARKLATTKSGRETLHKELTTSADERVRAAALAALAVADDWRPNDLKLIEQDWPHSLRAMAARWAPSERIKSGQLKQNLDQITPEVKAELLRRGLLEQDADFYRQFTSDPDPFIRHAAIQGWQLTAWQKKSYDGKQSRHPLHRVAAALMYRRSRHPERNELVGEFLHDPHPEVRLVAVQWAAEERLEQYRPQLLEMLKQDSAPRRLFEACLAALVMLDGEAPKKFDEDGGETYVARLVDDSSTAPVVRVRALRMLRPNHPVLTPELLTGFLHAQDMAMQLEAVRTLRDGPKEGRQALIQRVLDHASDFDQQVVCEAIMALSSEDSAQRLQLLNFAHSDLAPVRQEALRTLRGAKLSDEERRRLSAGLSTDPHQRAAEEQLLALIEPRELSAPAGDPLPDIDAWLKRLEGSADPAAGERIFFSARGAACSRCHQVDGRGGRLGPDLTATAAVLDRRRLMESIVNPSKEIAPQFVPWTITTSDGLVRVGMLVFEGLQGEQTYADAQGQTFTLKPEEIESREPHQASIMPRGLERLLTLQEFRDLLAFLQSRP